MKLARALTCLGLGLGSLALGCGGSSSSSSSDGGSGSETGGGDGGHGPSVVPPAPPPGPMTSSTTEHNFALHQLFLGDTDRQGNMDPNAWMNYGYNLDGKFTTQSSSDVCQLYGSPNCNQAKPPPECQVQIDGNGGIDNSFGANILPIITSAAGTGAPATINSDINKGGFTLMLDILGLDTTPTQTATGLSGQLFAGSTFPGMPTWTTADKWPVNPSLLNDPTDVTKGSKIKFSNAYVVNGTWVNGQNVDVSLTLGIMGIELSLTIHNAIITFEHSADAKATNGTIAGVINTQELINGLGLVVGRITNGSICPGSPTFMSIAGQIQQASDITTDPTKNAAGVMCDGISVGLGFNSDQIAGASMLPIAQVSGCPAADPCNPDAGSGSCDAGGPPPQDSGGGG